MTEHSVTIPYPIVRDQIDAVEVVLDLVTGSSPDYHSPRREFIGWAIAYTRRDPEIRAALATIADMIRTINQSTTPDAA